MAQSRSVFLYCMAAALHNPALSSLAPETLPALARYADLLRAENPNLPSVSPFLRMMDDAGRPAAGPSWFPSSRRGRTRSSRNGERIARRSFHDALYTCDRDVDVTNKYIQSALRLGHKTSGYVVLIQRIGHGISFAYSRLSIYTKNVN